MMFNLNDYKYLKIKKTSYYLLLFIFISLIKTAKNNIIPPIKIVSVKGSAKNTIAKIAPHKDSVDKIILPRDDSV